MTEPTELLPCPFCGSKATASVNQGESLWSHDVVDWTRVHCTNDDCNAQTEATCEGYEPSAIEVWNRRTSPTVAGEPVAWLSTDCIGERYLCFTKPNDSDPVRPLVFGDTTPQPAPATQQAGWTSADADAARLALELECLLMDTKDTAVVSKWWQSANEALELHRARLQEVQPSPTAQAAESVPAVDQSVMELAESVGLIGPASRAGDLHAAIQRFHDLICVNATIKAATMAAEVTCAATRAPAESVGRDAERLDFVERHPEMNLRHRKGKWAFLGFTNYEYVLHQSLREAIDAALAAQGGAA